VTAYRCYETNKEEKIEATPRERGGTEMSDEEENYYDDLAEAWESHGRSSGYGGGGGGGAKKRAKPTTVGKKRVGGAQAWGSSDKVCLKTCAKKCCSGAANITPAM
jgi:hypothetical protein